VVFTAESSGLRNELLRALPPDELELLRPHLSPVSLVLSQVLHETEAPVDEVYFLEAGLISLTADTRDNGQVEVGMTGREGFVGLAAILSPDPVGVHRALVQVSGRAHRVQVPAFRELLERSPALRDRCLRYVQVMLVQNSQIAACNARHGLPERLARWLLMSRDRIDADELPMTQEFLSYMLGVRRAGVSVVANALQSQGLIRQSRGRMTLLNRAGLEDKACSCYRVVEQNRARIMNTPHQPRASAA
jgi:CRP-like cAMP-binding protein